MKGTDKDSDGRVSYKEFKLAVLPNSEEEETQEEETQEEEEPGPGEEEAT